MAAALGLLPISAAMAAVPEACVVPAELKGFAHPAAAEAGTALVPGRAVRVMLARDARLPVAPEKAPAAGTRGGAFALIVTAAGRYRVVLDGAAWVDVVRGAARLGSVEHGHAPPCSGARKLVGYDLAPGRYVVQLSGAQATAATVMIVPAPAAG